MLSLMFFKVDLVPYFILMLLSIFMHLFYQSILILLPNGFIVIDFLGLVLVVAVLEHRLS